MQQHASRKHHELASSWTLRYDNARQHVATSIQQHLGKCNTKIMLHPYLQYIFRRLRFLAEKKKLHSKKFNTYSEVILAMQDSLKQLPEKACTYFEKWIERWNR